MNRAARWDAGSVVPVALGPIPGEAAQRARVAVAINDSGVVVGKAQKPSPTGWGTLDRAVRWEPGNAAGVELTPISLSPAGVGTSTALDVNAAGTTLGRASRYVVGTNGGGFTESHPVLWAAGSTTPVMLLGPNGVPNFSIARQLNDLGAAAGHTRVPNVPYADRAAVWSPSGTVTVLDTLLPAGTGWTRLVDAQGISDAGWVSGIGVFDPDGTAGPAQPYGRAFLMLVPAAGTYGQGDADFDGDVDFADLAVVAAHYGAASNGSTAVGDLDLDGDTDFADLATLAAHYGGAAPAPSFGTAFDADWARAVTLVPEPAALALVAPAVLGLHRVRFSGRRSGRVR